MRRLDGSLPSTLGRKVGAKGVPLFTSGRSVPPASSRAAQTPMRGCPASTPEPEAEMEQEDAAASGESDESDIVDTAVAAGSFRTLVAAVTKACPSPKTSNTAASAGCPPRSGRN